MIEISVVIPVMNEEENIAPLIEDVSKSLKNTTYEIIFVDDGSNDKTCEFILKSKSKLIRLIKFTRNYGQTAAMAAGIAAATGKYIATIDGDLQNDPSDIPVMLAMLKKEKLDIVVGKRSKRQDGWILRKIPSKIANYLIRKATKVEVSDLGCTLKVFKTAVAKKLDLYGELHRFIPILASIHGSKLAEIDVKHHPRIHGASKYGISRTFKVLSDLTLLLFFQKYRQKPMHLFGSAGFIGLILSTLISVYLFVDKFILGNDIGHRPLFFVDILLIITSIQFISMGFLAELLMRTYYAAENKKPYEIADEYSAGKRK